MYWNFMLKFQQIPKNNFQNIKNNMFLKKLKCVNNNCHPNIILIRPVNKAGPL